MKFRRLDVVVLERDFPAYGLKRGDLGVKDNALAMTFRIEVEQEADGRWIAEVLELAGAMTYGPTRDEAIGRAKALAALERLGWGSLPNPLQELGVGKP